ncbi:hypothetical protein EAY64_19945 [Aquitalea palustris]|uniref:Immunity protein 43 domain-containing protein n=2 Tax=Aquitalea palustris TaxID=2480983 RepID=A0A454JCY5_9NEIS|nr:hypothetical protein EAY64_19945 [Aquitalea palustris]
MVVKKYYLAVMSESDGCVSGFYSAILVDGVDKDSFQHYGKKPWYAGPKRFSGKLMPFPDGLTLIVNKDCCECDIRRGSDYFYVFSERFLNVIKNYKTSFDEIKQIVRVVKGQVKSDGGLFFVGRTKRISIADVVDFKCSKMAGEFNDMFEVLRVRADFDFDMFDMFDAATGQLSLVVSEELVSDLQEVDLKGVHFMPIDDLVFNTLQDFRLNSMRYYPV